MSYTPSLPQEIADVISETRLVIFKKLSGRQWQRQEEDECWHIGEEGQAVREMQTTHVIHHQGPKDAS